MNLTTEYLGLTLNSPFIVGASPFSDNVQAARRLEDHGASALVMRSLFEEQLESPPRQTSFTIETASGAMESFPDYADYQLSPDQYLRQLAYLKKNLSIPVIASLNGHQPGAWTHFASQLESAGADAIELNFYQVVTDPDVAADEVEAQMLEAVGQISNDVNIPVAVKLSPFHTAITQLAVALELAGAAGVVVFNRFYQPDINVDDVEVQPMLRLSEPQELLLRLRWLAILAPQLKGSLAATGGIHSHASIAKAILAGAHAVHLVSVLLRHGPNILRTLSDGLISWMVAHGYDTIDDFRGVLDLRRCRNAAAFERANYIRTLQSWKV